MEGNFFPGIPLPRIYIRSFEKGEGSLKKDVIMKNGNGQIPTDSSSSPYFFLA